MIVQCSIVALPRCPDDLLYGNRFDAVPGKQQLSSSLQLGLRIREPGIGWSRLSY
jgi:hypothetical protein